MPRSPASPCTLDVLGQLVIMWAAWPVLLQACAVSSLGRCAGALTPALPRPAPCPATRQEAISKLVHRVLDGTTYPYTGSAGRSRPHRAVPWACWAGAAQCLRWLRRHPPCAAHWGPAAEAPGRRGPCSGAGRSTCSGMVVGGAGASQAGRLVQRQSAGTATALRSAQLLAQGDRHHTTTPPTHRCTMSVICTGGRANRRQSVADHCVGASLRARATGRQENIPSALVEPHWAALGRKPLACLPPCPLSTAPVPASPLQGSAAGTWPCCHP